MKTYLPQIEPRKIVRPNIVFGILNYDLDNAYPQRMLELVGQSPTAKSCWDKRAKFIAGAAFTDAKLGDIVINETKGLTLNQLRVAIARDKALFKGFGIHLSYNANLKIAAVNYIPFEDIRIGNTENTSKFKNKYVLYSDWGKRSWKNIYMSKLTIVDKYNPDPKVIKQQIFDAGGWDKWSGQLFYFNPAIDDYPLIEADSVWEDFETEAGIKIFNNREVTTGFLPSTILTMPSRREITDDENPDQTGVTNLNTPSQLEQNLGDFQSTKKSQKIIVIEYDEGTTAPEFHPYSIQNNDKLFESTEKSVEARIIKGFSVPNALITSEKKSGLGDPGEEKKEAIREFNDDTSPDRLEISRTLERIFANFVTPITTNDWGLLGIPNEVAEDILGSKAGVSLNELLLSTLPYENKVWTLVVAYGVKEEEARKMASKETPDQGQTSKPAPSANDQTQGATK